MPINSSNFARVFRFEYRGERFYYKLFLSRNWLESLKRMFRRSRAERAFNGHLLLQENGFYAPCVNVIGVKGGSNFIVSQAVKGVNINQLFRQMAVYPRSKEENPCKRILIQQLGHTIGRLHKLGISHGDLRLGNIIVDFLEPHQPRCIFLDNERTVHYRNLPKRKRLKNIVQINITLDSIATKTDRMRLFHSYLQENPELIPMKKQWLARIIHKTQKRIVLRARHHATSSQKSILTDKVGSYV
jgi:tRNA A-37 threonylcarbamoyl transferase component Bud32